MTPFGLKIVTPDGMIFDGQADKVVVRTTGGDICILARHMDYVSPLGMGMAFVEFKGRRRAAACIGGMIRVKDGNVILTDLMERQVIIRGVLESANLVDGFVIVREME